MKYMLDTNTCIYLIKNKPTTVLNAFQKRINDGICISSITLAELEYGVAKSTFPSKNAIALRQFLSAVEVLYFDNNAAAQYGDIRAVLQRKGNVIGPLDMLIAGHARARELTLVTNNEKEFTRVDGLNLENWA